MGRRLAVAGAALAAAVGATPALGGGPMTLLLGKAQGRRSVTIGAATTHLHGRIWLYRVGGSGIARGSGTVSCGQSARNGVATGSDEYVRFTLRPNRRQELWRFGGGRCTVTATLHGPGLLRVELRGF